MENAPIYSSRHNESDAFAIFRIFTRLFSFQPFDCQDTIWVNLDSLKRSPSFKYTKRGGEVQVPNISNSIDQLAAFEWNLSFTIIQFHFNIMPCSGLDFCQPTNIEQLALKRQSFFGLTFFQAKALVRFVSTNSQPSVRIKRGILFKLLLLSPVGRTFPGLTRINGCIYCLLPRKKPRFIPK